MVFFHYLFFSFLQRRCALYRFAPDTKEWKERGRGDVKFLKHKDTKRVRIVMRQEKALQYVASLITFTVSVECIFVFFLLLSFPPYLFYSSFTLSFNYSLFPTHYFHSVRLNHYVPDESLASNAGSDKAWTWRCADFATDSGEPEVHSFAIRFGTPAKAQEFSEQWESARKANVQSVKGGNTETEETSEKAEESSEKADKAEETSEKAEETEKTEETA